MCADNARSIYVAIFGADTLLAGRPHDPVQLTRACQSVGFDLVVPASWGEEIIATQLADRLKANSASAYVAAVCPLVDERIAETPSQTPVLRTVPPAIATARYLRAALRPRRVHVTYVGACPGASDPEIEVHCLPQTLFTRLVDAGIDIARQPRHLDAQLPVERARYASVAGGIPDADWLMAYAEGRIIEAVPITVDAVTQLYRDEPLLIDLGASCRCVCARDRIALARMEPARSTQPVIPDLRVGVMKEPIDEPQPDAEASPAPASIPEARHDDRRARFAEFGLEGEAGSVQPNPGTLSRAMEPW